MAKMTAKFAGRCTACGERILKGSEINWTRGAGASHLRCGEREKPVRAAARRKPSAPKAPTTAGTQDGVQLSRWVDERRDVAGEIGRVFRAGAQAGPVAGQMITVVGAELGAYCRQEDLEDMGHYRDRGGYSLTLWVRVATADEAAPVLAREAEAASKAAALADLRRRADEVTRQNCDTEPPAVVGARYSLPETDRSTTAYLLTVASDGAVTWRHGGHYDSWRTTWGVTQDGAEVLALLAAAGIPEVRS